MEIKNNILINIPHSSLNIPNEFFKRVLIDKLYLEEELELITDLYVEQLFESDLSYIIKANFSRIFCDIERFKDEEKEIMSKIGMGVVYTKTTKGDRLIKCDAEYENFVFENYYDVYHSKLNEVTEKIINKFGNCIIIDAHSFSEELLKRTNIKYSNLPDFCIGFEKDFFDEKIVDILKNTFEKHGFSVDFNNPYSGSIVPNNYYFSKDNRVKSVMVEINKNIYLDKNNMKNDRFEKVKDTICEAIQKIEELQIINIYK